MNLKSKSHLYLLFAGFVAGSFAGAAFGLLFAVTLQPDRFFPRFADAVRMQPAQDLESSEDRQVVAAVKKVSPSVVSIQVYKDVRLMYNATGPLFFEEFFGLPSPQPAQPAPPEGHAPDRQIVGGGSGFVMTADGLILTNRHVVNDEAAEYEVTMQDGTVHAATVLARDAILDLAVLKIDAKDLPVAEIGSSATLEIGETVIAIGNALAEYQNSVTKGVVSGINRRVFAGGQDFSEIIEEAIQTDAAINPGNSGGPLIDLRGRVVGMNTAVNREGQSIGFAIPIDAAKVVIDSVRQHGRIVRPWLGVRYLLITPEMAKAEDLAADHGALVVKGQNPGDIAVVKDSPADKAGIKEGDIILEIDGQKIEMDTSLASIVAKRKAGDAVVLKVMRDGKEMDITATLGEVPENLK